MLSRRDIPCLPSSVITTTQGKAQGGEEEDLTRRRAGPANISEPSRGAANTISRFTSAQGEKGEESKGHGGTVRRGPHPPWGRAENPGKRREPPARHISDPCGFHTPILLLSCCSMRILRRARCAKSSGKRLYDSTRETQQNVALAVQKRTLTLASVTPPTIPRLPPRMNA